MTTMRRIKRNLVAAYAGTCVGVSAGLVFIHAATGGAL